MATRLAPASLTGNGAVTHSGLNLRENSIDFLRLTFAAAVIVAHSYGIGGYGVGPVGKILDIPGFGALAVFGFFFLSGFLVTRSYLSAASVWRYLWHRCLRIFPGFWCCLLVTVFVVGPIVCLKEGGALSTYFQHGVPNSAARYIQVNFWLTMHQYRIRDLLAHAPFPYTFDGALWTLHTEFLCYLFVAGLGVSGILRRARAIPLLIAIGLLALYLAALAASGPARAVYVHLLNNPYDESVSQTIYFFLGSAAYLYRDRLVLSRYLALAAFVLFAYSFVHTAPHEGLHHTLGAAHPAPSDLSHWLGAALMPVAFSYCVLWLAFRLPIRRFARHGDLSYGTYIYAFPIQQLLALYGLNRWGLPAYVALVLAGTLPIAFLSWWLVERPWLSLKRISWPRRGPTLRDHLPSAALPRLALGAHHSVLPLSVASSRRDVANLDCSDARE
jgi:peptidoglycan/LPS O-acetylase OafA/YrhL